MQLKRTVIKLSGEALSGNGTTAFCDATLAGIVAQVKRVLATGAEVSLVVGGGNFWRGRGANTAMDRVKADQIGMLATVMNALYLSEACKAQSVPALVMTPIPMGNMTTLYSKEAALAAMQQGTVVIHGAGLGHPYFSTDTVTALRAIELDASAVLYTKNGVGGCYDSAPDKNPSARMYRTLSYATALAGQLQFADLTALALLSDAAKPAFVFGLAEPDGIFRACEGHWEGFGTILQTHIEEAYYGNESV